MNLISNIIIVVCMVVLLVGNEIIRQCIIQSIHNHLKYVYTEPSHVASTMVIVKCNCDKFSEPMFYGNSNLK